PLATVDAFEPEGQWDWDALSERVAREALGSFRRLRPDGAR
ncbi:MAG: hypothetical protein QOE08_1408, partial [Thermoleophilaceae bacterium]|nr:hypothetical protein [Thermoleophilaceae bacterium]